MDLVYLDFAKAFDSVNHRFLLAKLKSSGIDHTRSKSTAYFLRRLPVLVAFPKFQSFAHYFFLLYKMIFPPLWVMLLSFLQMT